MRFFCEIKRKKASISIFFLRHFRPKNPHTLCVFFRFFRIRESPTGIRKALSTGSLVNAVYRDVLTASKKQRGAC